MNKKNGFTLIEVLISTAIMISVLGATVYGLSQSSKLIETMKNQDIAINAARDQLELISTDIGNVTAYHNTTFPVQTVDPGTGVVNQLLRPAPGQVNQGQITVAWIDGTPVNNPLPAGVTDNLFNVTATITWQEQGRLITRTLNTTLVQR